MPETQLLNDSHTGSIEASIQSTSTRQSGKLILLVMSTAFAIAACSGGSDSNPDIPDNPDNSGTVATPPMTIEPPVNIIAIPIPDNPTIPDNPNLAPLLAPLPSPPLTAAPSFDDEPVAENGLRHSVSGFLPVTDPGPRILKDQPVNITVEEFLAGPLEPTIEVPSGVDTTTNAPPFFENLTDQEIDAGQILTVRFIPRDPEGELPGLFPERLPEGSTFVDNFDGTQSLVWQPLQGDVGIREFTIVALDPANSLYRTRQTIRIRINLPDDPSTIPNRAPRIEEFVPHTVRVNDPVAIELKGLDLNNTIPTLSIANLPAGATFTRHPVFEEVFVLRYTPAQTGVQTFDVVSIDADDPTLTTSETIFIEVLDNTDFQVAGPSLRQLADNQEFLIGFASRQGFYNRPDGEIYSTIAAREFNLVTPENSMKMEVINPLPGRYQFADADNLVTFARQNNMEIHGHPLVWYTQLPEWIEQTAPNEREIHMREYITRVVNRYAGDVRSWDVVNEPVDVDGSLRNSVWLEAMGESYIDTAFRQTSELDPDAVLLLNDFDIEVNGPKSDGFFQLVDRLQSRNVPLDAIGFQMHLFSTFNQFDDVRANFQRAADRGLDIYITELDVSFPEGVNPGSAAFQQQAAVYTEVVSICLEQPRCQSLQFWGFTDQYSWREPMQPLLFDSRYQPKAAYQAVQQGLTQ